MAGVGEVEHRACPGGGRGGRGDQDGAGAAAPGAAADAARGRAVPARGLVGRGRAAAGRAGALARATSRPRRAGVSAFGISGTNAHIILEEAPAAAEEPRPADLPVPVLDAGMVPWVVSGRTAAGLAAQAGRLAAHLAAPARTWTRPMWRGRWRRPGRCSSTGRWSPARAGRSWRRGWRRWRRVSPRPGVVTGAVPAGGAGRVVFVFPGQGGQWAGMGRELAAVCPVFAARLAECGAALAPHVDWDLEDVIAGRRVRRGWSRRRGDPAGAVGGDGVAGGGVAGGRGHPGRGAGPLPGRDRRGDGGGDLVAGGRGAGGGGAQPGAVRAGRRGRHGVGGDARAGGAGAAGPRGASGCRSRR